jgi:hypothetical protein
MAQGKETPWRRTSIDPPVLHPRATSEHILMVGQDTVVTVIRATRCDTVHVRLMVPAIQSMVAARVVLEGVICQPEAREAIDDWVEIHGNEDRLRLITADFFRDSYGRILGDLQDLDSGEMLTDYLIDIGVAESRPNHYIDLLREMMTGGEA